MLQLILYTIIFILEDDSKKMDALIDFFVRFWKGIGKIGFLVLVILSRMENKNIFCQAWNKKSYINTGLFIMFFYHLFFPYRYLNLPHTAALSLENHNKRAWIERIVQNDNMNTIGAAVSVISSNNFLIYNLHYSQLSHWNAAWIPITSFRAATN